MSAFRGVSQKVVELVQKNKQDYYQSLPKMFERENISNINKNRLKRQFLRSGVDWPWSAPKMLPWSYFSPLPGRKTDHKQRIKVQRIAEAMNIMPDLIAEYREERRQKAITIKADKRAIKERDVLIEAASKRLTDMRDLVTEFDKLDDTWFDANDNYYQFQYSPNSRKEMNECKSNDMNAENEQLLASDSSLIAMNDNIDDENEVVKDDEYYMSISGMDRRKLKVNAWKETQKRRKEQSGKLAKILKEKPLLDPALDTLTEKDIRLRVNEKLDPMDGDYDDGKQWNKERTMAEMVYLQQLANEPNLEKEQEKHDKRRAK